MANKTINVKLLAGLVEDALKAGALAEAEAGTFAYVVSVLADRTPGNKAVASLKTALDEAAEATEAEQAVSGE
jgi:hypothetical protein